MSDASRMERRARRTAFKRSPTHVSERRHHAPARVLRIFGLVQRDLDRAWGAESDLAQFDLKAVVRRDISLQLSFSRMLIGPDLRGLDAAVYTDVRRRRIEVELHVIFELAAG